MDEFVYYNNLFDIYGCLLTDKERETFTDYYQEDLSLSEIADANNVSRTAVQKTVKNVIEKLEYYENKLGVYNKNIILSSILGLDNIEEIKEKIEEVLNN